MFCYSDGSKLRYDTNKTVAVRNRPLWISTLPCEIAAYIAIHTFGLSMIYPGSVKFVQSFLSMINCFAFYIFGSRNMY